jgi:hypothetical protein
MEKDLNKVGFVNGISLESCPVVGFVTDTTESSDSATRENRLR